ncbi:MAG: hypothetical protein DDT42_01304 [candidate division WS2 bacterium]|uniref:Uncharacterized protein n=1 Tax=Psychracetigena formicireducens TaxID=2986056 RepID=A0A9E2BH26_PSYF1|nr:hypothetical protein [Candidatus Psychracetigena formicireducens]
MIWSLLGDGETIPNIMSFSTNWFQLQKRKKKDGLKE